MSSLSDSSESKQRAARRVARWLPLRFARFINCFTKQLINDTYFPEAAPAEE
jgi:hypothetical protein